MKHTHRYTMYTDGRTFKPQKATGKDFPLPCFYTYWLVAVTHTFKNRTPTMYKELSVKCTTRAITDGICRAVTKEENTTDRA